MHLTTFPPPMVIFGIACWLIWVIDWTYDVLWASLMAQTVKNLPAMGGDLGLIPIGKIPWRRAWQPTPVFLPGESPWIEEPEGLQFMGSQKVGHD